MDNPAYSDEEKAAFRSTPAAMEDVRASVSRRLTDGFANVSRPRFEDWVVHDGAVGAAP